MDAKTIGEMSAADFNAYARKLGVTSFMVGALGGKFRARATNEIGRLFYGSGETTTEAIAEALAQVRGGLS